MRICSTSLNIRLVGTEMTFNTSSEVFIHLQQAVDANGAAVLLVHDAHILHINPELRALTGWSPEALIGKPIDQFIDMPPPGTRHLPREVRCVDGMLRTVACSVAPVGDALLMVTLLDALPYPTSDDLQTLYRAVSSSDVNYMRMLNNLTEAACIIDAHGVIVSSNEHCPRVSGYQHGEIIGYPVSKIIHADDVNRVEQAFAITDATGETQHLVYRVIDPHQNIVHVESYVHKLSRGSLLLVSHRADQPAQPSTESIRQNLELEQHLNTMRRTLLRLISHELHTPLAIILASSEIIERYYERLTDAKRAIHMQRIRGQVEYLRQMLEDITFTLGTEAHEGESPTHFVLDQVCTQVFERVMRTMGGEHQLTMAIEGEVFDFFADERYIARSIHTLLAIAIKHAEPTIPIHLLLCSYGDEYGVIVMCNTPVTAEMMANAMLITQPDIVQPHKPYFGLGMVILREYTRRLNGHIHIHMLDGCEAIAVFWPKMTSVG